MNLELDDEEIVGSKAKTTNKSCRNSQVADSSKVDSFFYSQGETVSKETINSENVFDNEDEGQVDIDESLNVDIQSTDLTDEIIPKDTGDNDNWETDSEEPDENEFTAVVNDAAFIPEKSYVNKYLIELQGIMKGKRPDGIFWIYRKKLLLS